MKSINNCVHSVSSQRHVSEGMALVGGPLVEMLNYCTAAKFEGFEAAESEYEITKHVSLW